MSVEQKYFENRAQKLIESLQTRKMEGYYCATKQEALNRTIDIISDGSTISWGGSQTLSQIGIIDELKKGNYNLFDRATAKTNEEITDIYHRAFSADYYLMSSNAITLDGKLVNIDGNGNRVACMIYGPKNVIIVAGMNKVCDSEEDAVRRARTLASPMNATRIGTNTPCVSTGFCYNCKEDDCICCNIVITRMSRVKGRIKVILVGENLGY